MIVVRGIWGEFDGIWKLCRRRKFVKDGRVLFLIYYRGRFWRRG